MMARALTGVLTAFLSTLLTSDTFAQNPKPAPARLIVRLPADATLYVDNTRLPPAETERTLETPDLEPGAEYVYTLRIEVVRAGRALAVSRKVHFKAGDTKIVDLGALLATEAAPPKVQAKALEKGKLTLSKDEQEVLDLVNEERTKAGAAPLRASAKLFQAARAHSANMAAQDQLAHDLDGKSPADRLRDIGYESFDWGENCAVGQRTPRAALESWMSSEGHRANILNDSFSEIGIGVAATAAGNRYWTQVFARPAGR